MVKCKNCSFNFTLSQLDKEKSEFLFRSKGITKIFVDCPSCGMELRVDRNENTTQFNFRCPVTQCSGWVDYVETGFDGTPFWGCGECGSRWKQEKSLFAEIVEITKQYPYRKKSYEKITKSNCIPGDMGNEVNDYEERVSDEKEDTRNQKSGSFFRD